MMILTVNPTAAAESSESDKWQFDLTLYLWLPKVDGALGFDVRVIYRYLSFDEGDDGFLRELSFGGPGQFSILNRVGGLEVEGTRHAGRRRKA